MTNVFVQGPLICIDEVGHDGRGRYSRENLEQVQARYPGATVADFDTWLAEKEKALCSEPVRITEERFHDMMDVLPPDNYQVGHGCASFEMCEHTSGRVTAVFVRVGNEYFEYETIAGQPIAAHVQKVNPMRNTV